MIKVLLKRTLEEGKVEFYEVIKESYTPEYGDELYRVELEDFELTPDTAKEGDRIYCIDRESENLLYGLIRLEQLNGLGFTKE